jgi:DNA-binding transcriptional LysR family regulator
MQIETNAPWDDLRVLLALHRQGSFLAVGKSLGISTSTAARRIDALEAALGRPLVQRTRSGTSIEPDALPLVALAEQLELGLSALRRDQSQSEAALSGVVRLSVGEGFVRPVVGLLSELRRQHPGLQFELVSEARVADLTRREADMAIRKLKSESPSLIERPAGKLSFGLYAARSYVDRRLPAVRLEPSELARHDLIGYDGPLARALPGQWWHDQGVKRFAFRSNSDHAIEEAIQQGQGVGLLAKAHARTLPGLVELRYDRPLPLLPVYLVFHKELRHVARHRLVVSALAEALRKALA